MLRRAILAAVLGLAACEARPTEVRSLGLPRNRGDAGVPGFGGAGGALGFGGAGGTPGFGGEGGAPVSGGAGGDSGPIVPATVVLRDGVDGYRGVSDTYVSRFAETEIPESVGNYGGAERMVVFDNGVRHALLRFDLARIPRHARIESASLELYVRELEYPNNPQLMIHRITAPWAEGTCLSQYDCEADGATWTSRGPEPGDWGLAGGDFAELVVAAPVPGRAQPISVDVTALVRRWVSGRLPNHGVLMRGTRAWSNSIELATSEAEDVSQRPGLVIRYRGQPEPGPGVGPLAPRVPNETCRLPELAPSPVVIEPSWPHLNFDRPLWLGGPGDGRRYVGTYSGTLLSFEADQSTRTAEVFLQIAVRNTSPEEGMLGVAFHPQYRQNGRLFTSYNPDAGERRIVLSEWQRDPANPRRAVPGSERVILTIPKVMEMHNGGDLQFGPDGFLYLSTGDGGDDADPFDNSRRPSRLLGKILRIDVDGARPYAIPADNPFAARPVVAGDDGPARPEVWAYGFRNPWRMGFDRQTGELFAGDVGEDTWESVEYIVRGGFYGWDYREGHVCQDNQPRDCPGEPEGLKVPIHTYRHDEGHCIIGGRVYRGGSIPELRGQYIFGDCINGRVWAADLDRSGATPRVRGVRLLGRSEFGISSFGEDEDGELYFMTFAWGHGIYRLLPRRGETPEVSPFPRLLSQTGCFADTPGHEVAAGVVPYDVAMPLWSDGADKHRFIALPPGGYIDYDPDNAFDVPDDTVLIKTFTIAEEGRAAPRRLETRLLARRAVGWEGFTYRWNEEQTDAVLLNTSVDEVVQTPDGPLEWRYPSQAQCETCHTPAAGYALGLRTRQLNRTFEYAPGAPANQLQALADGGYLLLSEAASELPAWPRLEDEGASLESRARGWMDANCSQCHRPGGVHPMDLRGDVPFAGAGICDAAAKNGELGVANARIIAPGASASSVLFHRTARRGPNQMPPLGTGVVPDGPVDVMRRWIDGMRDCE